MIVLSGFWIGSYSYAVGPLPDVKFDAELTHEGADVSGIITEPNTFDLEAGELLSAVVAGTVIGKHLHFDKTYTGDGQANHTVTYQGTVDAAAKHITGEWRVGPETGAFEMRRDGPDVGVKASLQEVGESLLEAHLEKIRK